MMTDGWPQDHSKPNGRTPQDFIDQMEIMRQGALLRATILRLGRPAEIHVSTFLEHGQMYIVDTSVDTDLYKAEPEGRLLIVHNGLGEDARALKDVLDRALVAQQQERSYDGP